MSETEIKRTRHRAEFVEEDYDDIPELVRSGRTSELKTRIEKVRDDNTGKPRLVAKYRSAGSASSAATGLRKAFATQGFKFAVRQVDDENTGLFVVWDAARVGEDDAPKPRKRKPKAEVAEVAVAEVTPEVEIPTDGAAAAKGRRR